MMHAIENLFSINSSDRNVLPNIVDPDQTAPKGTVWCGSALFAIQLALFAVHTSPGNETDLPVFKF